MIRTHSFVYAILLASVLFVTGCTKTATPSPTAATSAAQPAATVIDPATAASISGVVRFTGTAPAPQKIDMSADSGCKGQNQSETVMVDDGRLANVLVYVKDGLGDRSFAPSATPVTIAQQGCRYIPHVAAAMAGQPVEFLDNDDALHNIHPQPKNNPEWNQSQMPNSGTFAHTFNSPEVMIPIKCNQHPWMKMYLSVQSNPFFAVTGKDGSFTLKGLPPGNYTIAAAHEKYGEQEMKITAGSKNDKTGVTFGFRP
jgi:plastocyanin